MSAGAAGFLQGIPQWIKVGIAACIVLGVAFLTLSGRGFEAGLWYIKLPAVETPAQTACRQANGIGASTIAFIEKQISDLRAQDQNIDQHIHDMLKQCFSEKDAVCERGPKAGARAPYGVYYRYAEALKELDQRKLNVSLEIQTLTERRSQERHRLDRICGVVAQE